MKYRLSSLGILIVALSGCASTTPEMQPSFFVEFTEGSSALNNVFVLEKKLKKLKSGSNNQSSIILVANGHSEQDYNLALERMFGISKLLDSDVRVLVKESDVHSSNNLISVHSVLRWDEETRKQFEDAEFSDISQLNAIYRGDLKRSYYIAPKSREITTESKAMKDQLIEVGKKLGWDMDISNMEFGDKEYSFNSLTVNTLSPKGANSFEMKIIVENIIDTWFPKNEFDLNLRKRVVTITGSNNAN